MNFLSREIALRELFAKALKKTGSAEAVFYADIFSFFQMNRPFSLDQVKALWRERLAGKRFSDDGLHLQVDIPFCRQRCEFCDISKWVGSDASVLDRYVEKIIQEMHLLKDVFSGVRFSSFYFGNGSSELLRAEAVSRIFHEVQKSFVFEDDARKTFECNPSNTVFKDLTVLKEFGINRVSFGVQSLDQKVLDLANRGYQTYDKVRRAVQGVRTFLGLDSMNADLMIGLYQDSPETVCESFVKLADLGLESILLFPLVPNFYYLKKYYNNDKSSFDHELAQKIQGFEKLIVPVARRYGYAFAPRADSELNAASWDFVLKEKLTKEKQKYFFKSGGFQFDNLGIGSDSWSMISGSLYYTHNRSAPFLDCRFDAPKVYEGIAFTDSLYREFYVIRKFRDLGYVSLAEYRTLFGTDLREDFRQPLENLEQLGAVIQRGDVLAFLADSTDERFVRLLFFIGNDRIAAETDQVLRQAAQRGLRPDKRDGCHEL